MATKVPFSFGRNRTVRNKMVGTDELTNNVELVIAPFMNLISSSEKGQEKGQLTIDLP